MASAPAIFQKLMDTILQEILGVTCYIDNIFLSSTNKESHLHTLEEVFACLEKHGFRLKLEKFEFLFTCIEYLGYVVYPARFLVNLTTFLKKKL